MTYLTKQYIEFNVGIHAKIYNRFLNFCTISSSGITFIAQSKQLYINLLNEQNMHIGNIVAYLTPKNIKPSNTFKSNAIMDPINTQFLLYILVIQKDTQVDFPNSDSIKYHVYSF
jgi:hypothetical protein